MADLPAGLTDVQDGGHYRLVPRDDGALFGYNVGPNSWKSHLFPATLTLWKARRSDDGELRVEEQPAERPPYAFIGVRSCDIHAIAVQDRTFMEGAWADRDYQARREGAFIVAVNCGKAGGTCFCASMDTGPRARGGFDLALTELLDDGGHRFLVEVGSERGAEVLAELPHEGAASTDEAAADAVASPPPHRWGARSTSPTSGTSSTETASIRAGTRWPIAASPAATARWSARPASAPAWTT